jgi:D-galactarolactone cycloisomerase
MKITNVRTIQLTRKLSRWLRNACDARNQRRFTFVLVETDAGITGIGDALGNQNFIEAVIEKHYKNQAVGLDPCNIEGLWRKLYASGSFWEIGGSAVCALSAIEVACWDIRGKAEGVPVSQMLGGAKRDWIEAYASDLHWDEPQVMADMAKGFVDEGFRWVKTHIGAEHDNDLVRIEAIRRAIGPEIGLMIDINTAYDRQTALEQGRRQAAFDPFWFEEPIAPADYEGHAWLREQLPMPIAAGENLYTVYGFEPMFACRGCDYVMPDILRCGGIRQTRLICEAAEREGVIDRKSVV